MKRAGIFILLEGHDDLRYFDSVLKPFFEEKYFDVKTYLYAQKPKEKNNKLLESIPSMKYDYLVLSDLDNNRCITTKKEKLIKDKGEFKSDCILVVKKTIESWYIAGVDTGTFKSVKRKDIVGNESIDKYKFQEIFSRYYKSKIDVLQEILKKYSIEQGKKNNKSLEYLFNKHFKS